MTLTKEKHRLKEERRSAAYKALQSAVKLRFETYLAETGFVLFKKFPGRSLYHIFRRKSDFGYDLVAISFNKYAQPRFLISIARVPKEGVFFGKQHIPAEEVLDGNMGMHPGLHGRLYKRLKIFWIFDRLEWYGLSYDHPVNFEEKAECEITALLHDFKEAELWFSGAAGIKWNHLSLT